MVWWGPVYKDRQGERKTERGREEKKSREGRWNWFMFSMKGASGQVGAPKWEGKGGTWTECGGGCPWNMKLLRDKHPAVSCERQALLILQIWCLKQKTSSAVVCLLWLILKLFLLLQMARAYITSFCHSQIINKTKHPVFSCIFFPTCTVIISSSLRVTLFLRKLYCSCVFLPLVDVLPILLWTPHSISKTHGEPTFPVYGKSSHDMIHTFFFKAHEHSWFIDLNSQGYSC